MILKGRNRECGSFLVITSPHFIRHIIIKLIHYKYKRIKEYIYIFYQCIIVIIIAGKRKGFFFYKNKKFKATLEAEKRSKK